MCAEVKRESKGIPMEPTRGFFATTRQGSGPLDSLESRHPDSGCTITLGHSPCVLPVESTLVVFCTALQRFKLSHFLARAHLLSHDGLLPPFRIWQLPGTWSVQVYAYSSIVFRIRSLS